VMVSKNCGSVELVKSGVNGYIFEPMDMEEIKRLILGVDDVVCRGLIEGVGGFSVDEKDVGQVGSYL